VDARRLMDTPATERHWQTLIALLDAKPNS
jgi:hypothetical protein